MVNSLTINDRLYLQEYGDPIILEKKDLDIPSLIQASDRWKKSLGLSDDPFRIEFIGNGLIKLRAEAITGVVRVGNIDIEIAPKFLDANEANWQNVLWRILMVVEGGYIDNRLTSAHHGESLAIPDLLAEMFLASFTKGAARGLPRNYLTVKNQSSSLRGAFDISRISQWVSQPWNVPYISDFLSDDSSLSRLFRWSADCLSSTVKSPNRARALREIIAGLSHVGRRPPYLAEVERIQIGPQYQGLEGARIVGLLLLEGAGVKHAHGAHFLSGFLWNSDTIYENYIFWLCQRVAYQHGMTVTKNEITFGQIIEGQGSPLKTTPDVVFRDKNGNPIAIIDAKYKRFGSRPKALDTYQVFTAGHILGCYKISLTYPTSNSRERTIWSISSNLGGDDIELTALPINLMNLSNASGQQVLIDTIGNWLSN